MKLPNFGYHLARSRGWRFRARYLAALPRIVRQPLRIERDFPCDVYAYSGAAMLPEQVASIRSFLANAGRPRRFTIVSDGTYTQEQAQLLETIDSCVRLEQSAAWLPADVPEQARTYLSSHATGRQLALIMCLPRDRAAVYTDSDVLFFKGADDLAKTVARTDVPASYLADCRLSGDLRLFRDEAEKRAPVNTGFLVLHRTLDWTLAMQRLLELEGGPTFFTNQTLTHLAMHDNGADALDARKYVLQLDDQFIFPDQHASPAIALRHYVNPVRHKMWTTLRRAQ